MKLSGQLLTNKPLETPTRSGFCASPTTKMSTLTDFESVDGADLQPVRNPLAIEIPSGGIVYVPSQSNYSIYPRSGQH